MGTPEFEFNVEQPSRVVQCPTCSFQFRAVTWPSACPQCEADAISKDDDRTRAMAMVQGLNSELMTSLDASRERESALQKQVDRLTSALAQVIADWKELR